MPALSKLDLLVLQPTPFCNLDCRYCYLPHRSQTARMDDDTLRAVGRTIMASPCTTADTTLLWHAGEPCVLPATWYREACLRLEEGGGRAVGRQAFQTNATRIDDAWLDYFAQPGVSVGVSLDGPAEINDHWRVDRRGRGSFARTMQGIAALRGAGIPFHVICVVTAASLDHPERIAHALAETGAHSIGLNVEEVDGIHARSSLTRVEEAQYQQFLCRFSEALATHDPAPRLREADRVRSAVTAWQQGQGLRSQENTPGAIISVGVRGDISSFSPELLGLTSEAYDDFRFGNVHEIGELSEIFLSRAFLRCQRDISRGVARCRKSCAYFGLCGGGSPSNKLGETGRFDATETRHCRLSVKATVDTLLDRLETTSAPKMQERRHAIG
ncbi:cyclophane-forming radical SAM/SPASM peptide maturase GrrM/OscB [Roseobacter sinensis]|uniref:GRRM system radical SAM/SPASM domain protein n=1 Tax=Roseobacter sinensis TaxID=2931391 RepID=A0ABT3BGQ8_9RHOB|nr:cyclophane-forming radical SAM/SPASM peptide maturase GrrM/OscB [Roseobacter sp. WL0113]MCV3272767.1 GRRM system radical SAM/SPASM domain protein [Roseobacter sp. WL0113]